MVGDRVFVDSNVLRYALAAWSRYLWESQAGRCSWQMLDEFYANAVRKVGVRQMMARKTVGGYAEWQPGYWCDTAQVTYWDGKILAAAERLGCRWLLSEDFSAGRTYGSVTVINPFNPADGPTGRR